MKTLLGLTFSFVFLFGSANVWGQLTQAKLPPPTPYAITVQDANSRVWQRTDYAMSPSGGVVTNTHSYTEICSGLNHLVSGKWLESNDRIDILPNGTAVATNGQFSATFPGNIYPGQIEVVTPDGQHLKSRPLALAYFDGTNTVVIAELTNSIGVVVGNDQVVYPNSFSGLKVDVQYYYSKSGFEQNIVLKEQPPTPESLGISPDTARLQIFTEFFSPPQPTLQSTVLPAQAGLSLTDQSLNFGAMQMIQGRAFLMGQSAQDTGALVSKHWVQVNGRQFLVEEVPVDAILEGLAALPLSAMNSTSGENFHTASRHSILPPQRPANTNFPAKMMLAKVDFPKQGFVLDYQTVIGSSSNFTWLGDTTYYVSGQFNSYGTNTFEGGTVIKYATNGSINISPGPPGITACIKWKGDAYRPVIFTAIDDNSVGEVPSFSNGNPTNNYYGYPMLYLMGLTPAPTLTGLRMSYANTALYFNGCSLNIYGAQLVNCKYPISGVGVNMNLYNALFVNSRTNCFFNAGMVINAQNVTFNGGSCLLANPGSASGNSLTLSNCIFANITNLSYGYAVPSGSYNGFYSTPTFGTVQYSSAVYPFQSVGAGNNYLTNGSPFRNVGSTNIDPALLGNLKQKTTYSPVLLSHVTNSISTTLSPQAQRDTDTPDLGYHYDPLDYLTDICAFTNNVLLIISNGTAIANYNTAGISLLDGSSIASIGTALNPNWLVRYQSVQEQPVALDGTPSGGWPVNPYHVANPAPSGTYRFTKFACPAGGGYHIYHYQSYWSYSNLLVQDCEFWGGANYFGGNTNTVATLKNNLFWRSTFNGLNATLNSLSLSNNLFWGISTAITIQQPPGSVWYAFNNAFDTCLISPLVARATCTNGYNAYINSTNRLNPNSAFDIVTNTMVYQNGPLGTFYQPANSPLINKGSTNAGLVGLYHYTVTTNLVSGLQIKETNSIVDIGYHYVATDASGNPLANLWLGIPDYLADTNGELVAWELKYFGHIGVDPNGDYDGDGTNNLTEYRNGIDPNKISFSFSFANQYVSNNIVGGVITILGGVPSSIAVLVDSTAFATATWTAYTSSNITVTLGSTQGAHDVWVGLRGLPATAQQTWQETALVLDTKVPSITITNPANNVTFNSSRVNVSGNFAAGALKQITVNGVPAFVHGTNFNAVNVPLDAGNNVIVATLETLAGATNVSSINIITTTNLDGSLNNPVQLQATPVAGFSPLVVAFQVPNNFPGTLQQVVYDFNGDDVADFFTNNLAAITHSYTTNGEYFPFVTLKTTVGAFSSVGGWNAVALDDNNAPVRINVQAPPTVTSFASVTDPVDLKWSGNQLYVLSRGTATLTEFATNGTIIRSFSGVGSNPSGMDVDAAGNVYVAVTGNHQVWKYKPAGTSFTVDATFGTGGFIGNSDGSPGTGVGQFYGPFDVAVSPDGGTLSVSDSGNNQIQQFDSLGHYLNAFGSAGSATGQFNTPKGLTFDSGGTLYIVDSGNSRIVMAQGSTVTGTTGTYGTALGQFSGPVNLSIGTRGVYVADTGNNRIQKFDMPSHGLFTITPASIRYAFSTNFSQPYSVAAVNDLTNDLFYVADTGNNRVVLCRVPNNDANDIMTVWNRMIGYVNAKDFNGAATCFSVVSADNYLPALLYLDDDAVSDVNLIGPLTPVFIRDDSAQYYFEQTIAGQFLLFPVDFSKENGWWKIMQY